MLTGPMATMLLADQGAEVIKVEAGHGEQMRHLGMPHNGVNAMFYAHSEKSKWLSALKKQKSKK